MKALPAPLNDRMTGRRADFVLEDLRQRVAGKAVDLVQIRQGGSGGAGIAQMGIGGDQVAAIVPNVGPLLDRKGQQPYRLGVVSHEEMGTPDDPMEHTAGDAFRAPSQRLLSLFWSIRGDRVYPAGPITRRTLLSLHPLGNVICTVRVPGSVIVAALRNGVARFPATAGAFPQVSGLSFTIDSAAPPEARVTNVRVNGQPRTSLITTPNGRAPAKKAVTGVGAPS